MTEANIVAEPKEYGYSHVPNGLWTLDMSGNAKCLLGWLHSHTPAYLAALSVTRCEHEFGGGGSIRVWFKELEEAGFVRKDKVGNRWVITLLAEPWMALHRRRPAESAGAVSADPPERRSEPAESAGIEDQSPEDQCQDLPSPAVASQRPTTPGPAIAEPIAEPATRAERDALYQAIVMACGMSYTEMTKRQQKACAVAMAELAAVGATPAEVHRRASIYPQRFESAPLTPNALANQWACLREEVVAQTRRAAPGTAGIMAFLAEAERPDNVVDIRAVR